MTDLTLRELQTVLKQAGVRIAHAHPHWSDEPGVFIVFLVSDRGDPERSARVMEQIPLITHIEQRHSPYIYRVEARWPA